MEVILAQEVLRVKRDTHNRWCCSPTTCHDRWWRGNDIGLPVGAGEADVSTVGSSPWRENAGSDQVLEGRAETQQPVTKPGLGSPLGDA